MFYPVTHPTSKRVKKSTSNATQTRGREHFFAELRLNLIQAHPGRRRRRQGGVSRVGLQSLASYVASRHWTAHSRFASHPCQLHCASPAVKAPQSNAEMREGKGRVGLGGDARWRRRSVAGGAAYAPPSTGGAARRRVWSAAPCTAVLVDQPAVCGASPVRRGNGQNAGGVPRGVEQAAVVCRLVGADASGARDAAVVPPRSGVVREDRNHRADVDGIRAAPPGGIWRVATAARGAPERRRRRCRRSERDLQVGGETRGCGRALRR